MMRLLLLLSSFFFSHNLAFISIPRYSRLNHRDNFLNVKQSLIPFHSKTFIHTISASKPNYHPKTIKLSSSATENDSNKTNNDSFDIFLALKRFSNFFGGEEQKEPSNEYDEDIKNAKIILNRAAGSKKEDPNEVCNALEDLEKLMKEKRKLEPDTAAADILANLNGSWRLIFTTGTKEAQRKAGGKLNYFPLKAVQVFDTTSTPMSIENGIFVGDLSVIKFSGDFSFDLSKAKLEFDFDRIAIFGFTIELGKGKAAEIGSATGLGSEKNVKLAKKSKRPFFMWISADENIATARGGGGGIALWKKVDEDEFEE